MQAFVGLSMRVTRQWRVQQPARVASRYRTKTVDMPGSASPRSSAVPEVEIGGVTVRIKEL